MSAESCGRNTSGHAYEAGGVGLGSQQGKHSAGWAKAQTREARAWQQKREIEDEGVESNKRLTRVAHISHSGGDVREAARKRVKKRGVKRQKIRSGNGNGGDCAITRTSRRKRQWLAWRSPRPPCGASW